MAWVGSEDKNMRQWGMESGGSHAWPHSISTQNSRMPPFSLSENILLLAKNVKEIFLSQPHLLVKNKPK